MWMDEVDQFSEQQVVDCSLIPNFGCMGGEPKNAFYYMREKGVTLSKDYPYIDKMEDCKFDREKDLKAYQVNEFKIFDYPLNKDLQTLVCQGALASEFFINDCIKNYAGGIITDGNGECGCSDLETSNHALAIVGFGKDTMAKGCKKYWLLKNSWGSDWGEQGFMRLCREDDDLPLGTCSIRQSVILPISGQAFEPQYSEEEE